MVATKTFVRLALSFKGATERTHFEKRSFHVGKRIFATLSEADCSAVLKLSPADKAVFCSFDAAVIYPVSGTWGTRGWTRIELKKIRKEILHDALARAFCTTAPKRLSQKYDIG